MNPRIVPYLLAATAAGAAAMSSVVTASEAWPNTLSLVNGAVVRCRIRSATPGSIVIDYPRSGGTASPVVRREVPWSEIRSAEFVMDDEFARLLASRDPARDTPRLAARWLALAAMVSRPHHPAGELGLSLARLSLDHADPAARRRALGVCHTIASSDWNFTRRHNARLLQSKILASLGRKEEAVREARRLATEAGIDPAASMPAHLMLASEDFASLRALEEANPMWRDDDLVRPERDALLHRALEAALKPSLFHGALEDPSTLGLWTAVQVLEFAGRVPAAAECARDLLRLYPSSAAAAEAASFLERHHLADRPAPPSPDPSIPANQPPATSTPPPPSAEEPVVQRRPRYAEEEPPERHTPATPHAAPAQ